MNHFEKVFQCFPDEIRRQIDALPASERNAIEEIRVYREKEVQLFAGGQRISLHGTVDGREIHSLMNSLMKFSYYAYEEDLARGFITIDGGHRVGICGKAVVERGKVTLLRDISSLNIRHCREIPGCGDSVLPYAVSETGALKNLLVVSPPGCGKTTLIRDLARSLSLRNYKVAICDERSEIAGMSAGLSPYSFGAMVDVLDGCPKAEGMIMLVRSMSPQVIFTDEIGTREDADAVRCCLGSGVRVITTAHGNSLDDLKKTGICRLIEDRVFDYLIFLTDWPKAGTVREVLCG